MSNTRGARRQPESPEPEEETADDTVPPTATADVTVNKQDQPDEPPETESHPADNASKVDPGRSESDSHGAGVPDAVPPETNADARPTASNGEEEEHPKETPGMIATPHDKPQSKATPPIVEIQQDAKTLPSATAGGVGGQIEKEKIPNQSPDLPVAKDGAAAPVEFAENNGVQDKRSTPADNPIGVTTSKDSPQAPSEDAPQKVNGSTTPPKVQDTPLVSPESVEAPPARPTQASDPLGLASLLSTQYGNTNELHGGAPYVIQLKADEEGVTQNERDAHVQRIESMCPNWNINDIGQQLLGIERKLEKSVQGYFGIFSRDMIEKIRAMREYKSHLISQRVKLHSDPTESTLKTELCSRNWAVARLASTANELPDPRHPSLEDPPIWNFAPSDYKGAGTIIFVIDEGGYCVNDIGISTRIVFNASTKGGVESHTTNLVSFAAGDTCGIAPDASLWVYSPEVLTTIGVIAAIETVAAFDYSTFNVRQDGGILNCSWTFPDLAGTNVLTDAMGYLIMQKLVKVVASAGNDGRLIQKFANFPQNMSQACVIGSSDERNELTIASKHGFAASNYGPGVSFYAPGINLRAPLPAKSIFRGSSFAAAHASGLISVLISSEIKNVTWKAADVKRLLRSSFSRVTQHFNGVDIRTITRVPSTSTEPLKVFQTPSTPTAEGKSPEDSRMLLITQADSNYHVQFPGVNDTYVFDVHELRRLIRTLRNEPDNYAKIARMLEADGIAVRRSINSIEGVRFETALPNLSDFDSYTGARKSRAWLDAFGLLS